MRMEKDKKYNIILGLMIFLFILFVGICIAWGLGIISINTNKTTNNNTSYVPDNKETVQSNVPSVNNEENILTESEVETLNKKYIDSVFGVMFAGSTEGMFSEIMGEDYSYEKMASHYTGKIIDEKYKVTDIDYNIFINKMPYLSQDLFKELCLVGPEKVNAFKEYNGKVAIWDVGWTGYPFKFDLQKLKEKNGNEYEWTVSILGLENLDATEYTVKTEYGVKGKVEGQKYILTSVEKVK